MENPVLAEVTRGNTVESQHRGAFVVADARGVQVVASGDITRPIFPRSAIKAFQCIPLIDSGAARAFDLDDREIALCCASHNGEPEHVAVAQSILRKSGIAETCLACGAHLPSSREASDHLLLNHMKPSALHNNCSGKHAGMLALAKHIGADLHGYTDPSHPVQKHVAATITKLCDVDLKSAPMGIDGCSAPTWAVPLQNLAQGFARLASPEHAAGREITAAVKANPFMVAGSKGFDTLVMQDVPRVFIKVGAEGVYCGCIPHAGLGFSLKIDDGAVRAAEVAIASVLASLDSWTDDERASLHRYSEKRLKNWRGLEVGAVRSKSL